MTFNPPEGATIITPQVNQLDSSSTITRGAYQDALTVKAEDISAIDYLAPQKHYTSYLRLQSSLGIF